MKNLKKIAAVILVAIIGSAAFADYAGNLQLRFLGVGSNTLFENKEKINTSNTGIPSEVIKFSPDYEWEIFTEHTWMIVRDILGVGFMYGANFGVRGNSEKGSIFSYEFSVGPAVSVGIGRVLRIYTGLGVNWGGWDYNYGKNHSYYYSSSSSDSWDVDIDLFGFGVAWDFNVVFLPNSVFTPVIGFKLSTIKSKSVYSVDITFPKGWSSTYSGISVHSGSGNYYKLRNFEFFLGGSFNFGRERKGGGGRLPSSGSTAPAPGRGQRM